MLLTQVAPGSALVELVAQLEGSLELEAAAAWFHRLPHRSTRTAGRLEAQAALELEVLAAVVEPQLAAVSVT